MLPKTNVVWMIVIFCLTTCYGSLLRCDDEDDSNECSNIKQVCYYVSSSQSRPGEGTFFPEDINPSYCTHLVFFQAYINDQCHLDIYNWNDEDLYERFNAHKLTHPGLRTMLAVGSSSGLCSMASEEDRLTFASQSVDYLREWNFDGLELHFMDEIEDPDFKTNFATLLQDVRHEFDEDESGEETLLLTVAGSGRKSEIDDFYDVPEIDKYVDWIGLRTYYMHPIVETDYTSHHSPLHPRSEETGYDRYINVEFAVSYWLELGASERKLVVGISASGTGRQLDDDDCTSLGCPASNPSPIGEYTRTIGLYSHYEICEMHNDISSEMRWNTEHMAPYSVFHTEPKIWVGHENDTSLEAKTSWLLDQGLGGWMMWSVDTDDFTGEFCNMGEYPILQTLDRSTLKYHLLQATPY